MGSISGISTQVLWTTGVVLVLAVLLRKLHQRASSKLNFPIVGTPHDKDFSTAIIRGAREYPSTPFIIPVQPPRLILPLSLYRQATDAPEHEISFFAEMYDLVQGQYTNFGVDRPELWRSLRNDLATQLPAALRLFQESARDIVEQNLFDGVEEASQDGWVTVPVYAKLLRVLAVLSGRAFLGEPFCYDKEWVDVSINYTRVVAMVIQEVLGWRTWMRPIVAPWLASIRNVRATVKKAEDVMRPLVEELVKGEGKQGNGSEVEIGDKGTLIRLVMRYLPKHLQTFERITSDQLLLAFASIHTTAETMAFVLFDLVSYPGYLPELEQELRDVLAEDGEIDDGILSRSSIAKLRKLDSFIKESQRLSPLEFLASKRKVLKDFTFDNGLTVPKGTHIAFPLSSVHISQQSAPSVPGPDGKASSPQDFDGFRYAKLRETPGQESMHQAAAAGVHQLNFGHGLHACPGRFLGIYEIKAILVYLLRHYEMRLAPGCEGRRPDNFVLPLAQMPNLTGCVEFRRRDEPI